MATEKRLIDAKAYKASLTKWKEDAWKHNERRDAMLIADCLCELETMPTVDAVEVVHGCMRHVFCSYQDNHFQCTCCNGNFITNAARYWNYCPNCGAKMDGDGNG